ncbi:MAG: hypothetical protein J7L50_02580 [Candidatus Odinarchaeota archaeon]|nr:hypothetical protein [Candidatus Odinarchaeota archaeon]
MERFYLRDVSPFIFYAKYPWLGSLRDFVEKVGLGFNEETLKEHEVEVDEAVNMISHLIRGRYREIDERPSDFLKKPVEEFYKQIFARILVSILDDRYLRERYAVFIQKRTERLLMEEDEDVIFSIAKDEIGWNVNKVDLVVGGRVYKFSIDFKDYLDGSSGIDDRFWSLSNRVLKKGSVLLSRRELVRLISQKARNVVRGFTSKKSEEVPYSLKMKLMPLRRLLSSYKRELKIGGKLVPRFLPPCIRNLLEMLKKGENIPHFGRFTLTSFLVNIGMRVEDILELLSNSPDVDEKIARYQIEHIAGLRGSGTKYKTPNCETLKKLGSCSPDERCKNVKSPIVYYSRMMRRRSFGGRK